MANSFLSPLFGGKKSEPNEIDRLFSFLSSITHNPDAIETYLYRYNKIKKSYRRRTTKAFIELYLDWEEFIVGNRPVNNRQYTKETLRESVRREIKIDTFENTIRLIFLPKRDQSIELYKYFVDQLAKYIVKNLGIEKLGKTLKNLQSDPIIAKIRPSGETVNFELVDNIVVPNNIDYPLDEVTESFKHLVSGLYNVIELSLGSKVSVTLFNKSFTDLKENYNAEMVAVVLKIVPEKVLDRDDWIALMSKQELEKQVKEKTDELENLAEALETEVGKRTKELKEAYDELKILDEKKSEFISVAAHQLRTPLSGLKWSLTMIKDGDLGPVTEEQKDFLNKGLETNDRVISIINDLLDIDLLVKDKVTYTVEPTDLVPIINTAINDLEPQAKRKGIRFVRPQMPRGMKMIAEVDGAKISVVIQNLIDNAIKYCEDKDVITVKMSKINTMVNISIEDTGIGVPKKSQEDMFKRFFRADNAVRKVTEGSGIGLFISKNIIEDHGGRIWFESEEGVGTTFYISLPMHKNTTEQGLNPEVYQDNT